MVKAMSPDSIFEKPVIEGRPVRSFYLKEYFLALALVFTVVFLWVVGYSPFMILVYSAIALAAFLVFIAEFSRLRSYYRITPSHVILEEGIVSRKRKSFSMANVSDISVRQGYVQRALRFGIVMVGSSSGREFMSLDLKVKNPRAVAARIEKLIKDYDAGT
ncbi:MAG: PH domain-containing protein [Candidatus Aenigmatarchaeota archaeon]